MEKEFFGIGRGYLLAFLLVAGFIAMMLLLIGSGVRMADAKEWAGLYTTFAVPILAVVVVPKEAGKIFTKKNGGNS